MLVAIAHPAMRRYTRELLEREYHCWVATEVALGQPLDEAIEALRPDLLVVDTPDVANCCAGVLGAEPKQKVVVIGPEPDSSYLAAALKGGAGAWICRDRVAEELGAEMRRLLGCVHDPCPADEVERLPAAARRSPGDC